MSEITERAEKWLNQPHGFQKPIVATDIIRNLLAEIERWKAEYMGAAELVATIYEAVTGNTGGPVRGVVEDVHDTIANLTAERDLFKKETVALATEPTRRQTIEDCVKAIESLPARVEPISGQNFTYVQRGEVIGSDRWPALVRLRKENLWKPQH